MKVLFSNQDSKGRNNSKEILQVNSRDLSTPFQYFIPMKTSQVVRGQDYFSDKIVNDMKRCRASVARQNTPLLLKNDTLNKIKRFSTGV